MNPYRLFTLVIVFLCPLFPLSATQTQSLHFTSYADEKKCDFIGNREQQRAVMMKSVTRTKQIKKGRYQCLVQLPQTMFNQCYLAGIDMTEGRGKCDVTVKKSQFNLAITAADGVVQCSFNCVAVANEN
ncbi:hypothetical protein [Thaumasiovibrio sp. DFM-14]|uniref:hypothetical protein n=1 Tax=Thaumasiovibrio sp. DFM-14 TaxID=3384792 RepID=UPI0039A3EE40